MVETSCLPCFAFSLIDNSSSPASNQRDEAGAGAGAGVEAGAEADRQTRPAYPCAESLTPSETPAGRSSPRKYSEVPDRRPSSEVQTRDFCHVAMPGLVRKFSPLMQAYGDGDGLKAEGHEALVLVDETIWRLELVRPRMHARIR